MSEKQPYQKPNIQSEELKFVLKKDNSHNPELNLIRMATTNKGIEIYRKKKGEDRNGNTIEEQKGLLQKLTDSGVSVEVPFKGGVKDELISLGEGERLDNFFKKLNKTDQNNILKKIAKEIAKMHNCGISHNDLCPKNIVADKLGKISLIDFEFATELNINERQPLSKSPNSDVDLDFFAADIATLLFWDALTDEQIELVIDSYIKEINILDQKTKEELKQRIKQHAL